MIRLSHLLNEATDLSAKSKDSGKLVHFKSKDSYEKAIKAGSHLDPNSDSPKGASKTSDVNIFNTPTKDEPKSEPNKSEPVESNPQRKGHPAVNKEIAKLANKLGMTPKKLGKDEYPTKMAQAAYAALIDSNFSTEARQLVADLEGKPELAEKPEYPSMKDPKYKEKMDVIRAKYDSVYSSPDEDVEKFGVASSETADWDGGFAIDGIATELRKYGFNDMADKIQSVIKEGKRTSLKNLMK